MTGIWEAWLEQKRRSKVVLYNLHPLLIVFKFCVIVSVQVAPNLSAASINYVPG